MRLGNARSRDPSRVDVRTTATERGFQLDERPLRRRWVWGWRRSDDTRFSLLFLRTRGAEVDGRPAPLCCRLRAVTRRRLRAGVAKLTGAAAVIAGAVIFTRRSILGRSYFTPPLPRYTRCAVRVVGCPRRRSYRRGLTENFFVARCVVRFVGCPRRHGRWRARAHWRGVGDRRVRHLHSPLDGR